MLSFAAFALLSLVPVLVPGLVFWLAVRRLWQSRSRNAVLYWLTGAFAGAAAVDAVQAGLAGRPLDPAGMAVAVSSLPLWLVVRAATARRAPAAGAGGAPVFASVRPGGRRAGATGLRGRAPQATRGA